MENSYQIDLNRTSNVPVTEGIHTFEIIAGDEGEGAKGAYWKFTMACQTPGEDGKNVLFIVSLSPQARWRLELFLDAVRAPQTGTATVENFIGRKLRAKVVHEEYEGRVQARLAELFPAVRTAPANPSPTVKVVKAAKVVKKSEEPLPFPSDVTEEEDLPFDENS